MIAPRHRHSTNTVDQVPASIRILIRITLDARSILDRSSPPRMIRASVPLVEMAANDLEW